MPDNTQTVSRYPDEKSFVLLLFFGSLLLRIIVVLFFNLNEAAHGTDMAATKDDQIDYWEFARSILASPSWLTTHVSRRAPVYPMFLASVTFLLGTGKNFINLMLVQCIISALSVIIIYSISRTIFSRQAAILASIWAAFYPHYLKYSGFLLRETLLVFLFLLFFLILVRYLKGGNKALVFSLGVVYVLLIHTDPRFLFHLPFVLLYLYIGVRDFRKSLKVYVLLVSVIVLFSLPWAIRNYIVYKDQFVLIDNTVLGEWTRKPVINLGVASKETLRKEGFGKPDTLEKFEAMKKKAILSYPEAKTTDVSEDKPHIPHYAKISSDEELRAFENGVRPTYNILHRYFYHFTEFWRFVRFKPSYCPYPDLRFEHVWTLKRNLIGIFFSGLLIPLLSAGIFFSVKQRNTYGLILSLIILVHTLLHVIVHSRMRYIMPITGFIIMLAFYGFTETVACFKKRGGKTTHLSAENRS